MPQHLPSYRREKFPDSAHSYRREKSPDSLSYAGKVPAPSHTCTSSRRRSSMIKCLVVLCTFTLAIGGVSTAYADSISGYFNASGSDSFNSSTITFTPNEARITPDTAIGGTFATYLTDGNAISFLFPVPSPIRLGKIRFRRDFPLFSQPPRTAKPSPLTWTRTTPATLLTEQAALRAPLVCSLPEPETLPDREWLTTPQPPPPSSLPRNTRLGSR